MEKHGSANFENMLSNGAIVGTPAYASYEPHHERCAGGAWNYVNMYYPINEVALRWIAEGRDIVVDDLWVVTEGDGLTGPAYIRVDRGGCVERTVEIDCKQIMADGFDIEEDGENVWYSARVYGNVACMIRDIVASVGDEIHFFRKKDKKQFLAEVREIYDEAEERDEEW